MSLTDRHTVRAKPPTPTTRPLTPQLIKQLRGRTVKVHRNLQNGLWSITFEGKVVAHAPIVHLRNVGFAVSRAGHKRCLVDKQKNVHAWARGFFCEEGNCAFIPISYDPYLHEHFYVLGTETPVYTAVEVTLSHGKAYAADINQY